MSSEQCPGQQISVIWFLSHSLYTSYQGWDYSVLLCGDTHQNGLIQNHTVKSFTFFFLNTQIVVYISRSQTVTDFGAIQTF